MVRLTAQKLLQGWLRTRLDSAALVWLIEKEALFATGGPERLIFTAFSTAIRFSGKAPLNLSVSELAEAKASVAGWNPSNWTCDEAIRVLLLLALPSDAKSAKIMDQIYHTADVGEAVAMQKALSVLANPEGQLARAREGIRNNIQLVFEAVCLRNPYPALYFDEVGWNQVVVKTIFLGLPVHEVIGLDRRANANLACMLDDLAQERWAAGREFNPELWRCVGPYANARALEDLKRVLTQASPIEKRAAALALLACPNPQAVQILDMAPALAAEVRSGNLTWENLYHGN
jgi:hypothetical protein